MEKTYSPQNIEQRWYTHWETQGLFKPTHKGTPYCIMLPPPNVTGSLHMGHGFQHTLMDALIRYKKMCGSQTLWQPGTDHAGISTQLVVEGQLNKQGLSRKQFSREAFLDQIWAWKANSGSQITQQMRRIGSAVDWSRERFTMDPGFSEAVQQVFIQLYKEGLIYRGQRLVNWDPILKTAISDLEVLSEETQGFIWSIQYDLVNAQGSLVVATTRPETLFGDVAVAVHPEDERYQHWIGQFLHLPLCDRMIPIIADEHVDPAFGTGCVKVTPAHDFNDYDIGKRHNLEMINIFTTEACLNDSVPLAYRSLDRFSARQRVLEALTAAGKLVDTKPHVLHVPRGEKSNAIIEPLLTEQWYIKMAPLAAPAIEAVRKGDVRLIPEQWESTYFHWMEHIEDWCISRQLWWGHRIPAWYDTTGQCYVGETEESIRKDYAIPSDIVLTQDEDVLDTWFSSALWPFVTLGWPATTEAFDTFYTTSVLVTGFDILFFWVARMIMMGLKFTGKIPFHTVLITGLICDHEGKKMSKSKGNVLDPIDIIDGIPLDDLIEKRTRSLVLESSKHSIIKATTDLFPKGISAYGTDALRFTFCAMASNTRTVRFDLQRVEGYRNFCNKLWNASRYVLSNLNHTEVNLLTADSALEHPLNQWIVSQLQQVIKMAHQYYTEYRFDLLAQMLYEFVWNQYCDWYIELSKSIPSAETQSTLLYVLDAILKLLHPLIPFITEEIWHRLKPLTKEPSLSILLTHYPQVHSKKVQTAAVHTEIEWLKQFIQTIRTIRSEHHISPSQSIELYLKNSTSEIRYCLEKYESLIMRALKLKKLAVTEEVLSNTLYASAVIEPLELFIPLDEFIDINSEVSRLSKEIQKLTDEMKRVELKLNQTGFIDKAPAHVIEKEQAKLALFKETLQKQQHHLEMLLHKKKTNS